MRSGLERIDIEDDKIDKELMEKVCKTAQIYKHIQSLPKKFNTIVGEHGHNLSVGQKQRLGIARILYRKPKLIILDEATSALDGITEEKVMSSILEFSKDKTIILIAHRLTTLQECETIFLFEQGKLVDQGKYEKLVKTNSMFYRMTRNINNKKIDN